MSYAYNDAMYSIQTDICKYNGNCKVRWLAYVIKKGGHGFLQNDALPRGGGNASLDFVLSRQISMSVVITKFRKMELVCLLVWIGWKVSSGQFRENMASSWRCLV